MASHGGGFLRRFVIRSSFPFVRVNRRVQMADSKRAMYGLFKCVLQCAAVCCKGHVKIAGTSRVVRVVQSVVQCVAVRCSVL